MLTIAVTLSEFIRRTAGIGHRLTASLGTVFVKHIAHFICGNQLLRLVGQYTKRSIYLSTIRGSTFYFTPYLAKNAMGIQTIIFGTSRLPFENVWVSKNISITKILVVMRA